MALKTGNPFIDALGGTPWAKTPDATGMRVFKFFLDNDTSAGPTSETSKGNFANSHSTGGAWTQTEQDQFALAVSTWSSVANIRFVQVTSAADADLIERKQTDTELTDPTIGQLTGEHGSPDSLSAANKKLVGAFNTQAGWNDGSIQMGGARFGTIIHEIGHALGLAHPHDTGQRTGLFPGIETGPGTTPSDDTGDNGLNARINTIMSYAGRASTSDYGHIATPMAFDIAAIQLMYGAVHNATGNNTYFLNDGEARGTFYSCIWDTKGIDTIQYDGAGDATIDLRAAWLGNNDGIANDQGAGGYLSSVSVRQADGSMKQIDGGYTIAADITGFIPDQNGDWGVIIENATGGSGNDRLFGNGVSNTLTGGAGNDHLNGFGGNDVMLGGTGDDQYVVDAAGDIVIDTFGTTGGHDTIYMYWHAWDMRVGNKGSWVEDLEYLGNGAFVGDGNNRDNVINGGAQGDTIRGNGGHDTLRGAGGNDWLFGGAGNDTLRGGIGNDTLDGGANNDSLDGGTGNDTLVGGLGDDWMFGNDDDDTMDGGAGNDRLDGGWGNDTLVGGANNDTLLGSAGIDKLVGGAGNDQLNGGDGADTLDGGTGNDTYYVDNQNDTIVEAVTAAGGIDTIITGLGTYAFSFAGAGGQGVENLTFTGNMVHFGEGNALKNIILGADGGDVLYGKGGDDTLRGGAGNDLLDGGEHNDTLEGGIGSDDLRGGAGRDQLFGGSGDDALYVDNADKSVNGGDGFDYVYGDDSTIATGFKFAVGGKSVEQVFGNAGSDVIDATATTDTRLATQLYGNGGNDIFKAGAGLEWFGGGQGSDSVVYSGTSNNYTIYGEAQSGYAGWSYVVDNATGVGDWLMSIEKLQFSDRAVAMTDVRSEILGTGKADIISGSGFNEEIFGGGGKDVLDGGGGSDILYGGFGVDELRGGAGNDLLYIDEIDSVIDGGTGWDQVYADESQGPISGLRLDLFALNVEAAFGGRGNDFFDASNVKEHVELSGQAGNDVLMGGTFSDILSGGAGEDWFVFSTDWGDDFVADFNNAEGDKIEMSKVAALDRFEQLTFTGNGDGVDVSFGDDSIHLSGISAAQVQSDWFIL